MEQDSGTSSPHSELTLRLLSAFFLVGITLAGSYLGGWYFSALILLMALLMSWEWFALTGAKRRGLAFVIQCAAMSAAAYFATETSYLYSVLILAASSVTIFFLTYTSISISSSPVLTAAGSFYSGLPAIAMIWFRHDSDYGFLAVLYLFTLAWSSDSAAFFGGRTIGGAKLWPSVSPKKTWSGFISGLVACVILGVGFSIFDQKIGIVTIVVISVLLGIAVQAGDLAESAMKRHFGLKDSSALIPGHGGVLDRVDGLVFAVVLAAVFALIIDRDNPGSALLQGEKITKYNAASLTAVAHTA